MREGFNSLFTAAVQYSTRAIIMSLQSIWMKLQLQVFEWLFMGQKIPWFFNTFCIKSSCIVAVEHKLGIIKWNLSRTVLLWQYFWRFNRKSPVCLSVAIYIFISTFLQQVYICSLCTANTQSQVDEQCLLRMQVWNASLLKVTSL